MTVDGSRYVSVRWLLGILVLVIGSMLTLWVTSVEASKQETRTNTENIIRLQGSIEAIAKGVERLELRQIAVPAQ